MKKKVWFLAPIVALLVGAICFFAGTLKDISYGADYTKGGHIVIEGGTYTFDNGTISSSDKVDYGGGVYISGGTFKMWNGTISGNSAGVGGGVYVNSGTFEMRGGTISDNTASWGGGVMVEDSGVFNMYGGTIKNNSATMGPDVCVEVSGKFHYYGGTISGEIWTNVIINIHETPRSPLKIRMNNITGNHSQIAIIDDDVMCTTDDFVLTNMPSGCRLYIERQNGKNYLICDKQTNGGYVELQYIRFERDYAVGSSAGSLNKDMVGIPTKNTNSVVDFIYFDVDGATLNIMRYRVDTSGNKYDELIDSVTASDSSSSSRFLGWFWGCHEDGELDDYPPDYVSGSEQRIRIENDYQKGEFPRAFTQKFVDQCAEYGDEPTIYARFSPSQRGTIRISVNPNQGYVIGPNVVSAGSGYYNVTIPSDATNLSYKQGMFTFDNKNKPLMSAYFEIVPKLGYYISSLSGVSFSPNTASTTSFPSSISCTFASLSSSSTKITIGYYNRSTMTRKEMCLAYMLYYTSHQTGASSSAYKSARVYKVGRPVYDFSYYDDYTDSELKSFLDQVVTMKKASNLYLLLTPMSSQFDMAIGDEIVGPDAAGNDYSSNYNDRYNGNSYSNSICFIPTSYDVENRVSGSSDLTSLYIFWNKNLDVASDYQYSEMRIFNKNLYHGSGTAYFVIPGKMSPVGQPTAGSFNMLLSDISQASRYNLTPTYASLADTTIDMLVSGSINLDWAPFLVIDSAIFSSEYIKRNPADGPVIKQLEDLLMDYIGQSNKSYFSNTVNAQARRVDYFWDAFMRDVYFELGSRYSSYAASINSALDGMQANGLWASASGSLMKGVLLGSYALQVTPTEIISEMKNGWQDDILKSYYGTDYQIGNYRSYYDFLIDEDNDAINFLLSKGIKLKHWMIGSTDYTALPTSEEETHQSPSFEKLPNDLFFDNKKFYLEPIRKER